MTHRVIGIAVLALALASCGARRKAVEANNRAFGMLAQKRYADAIAEFERGIQQDPKLPELHLGLGRAYEETQQNSKAEVAFDRYTKLRPDDPDGHYYLGLVLDAQNRPRQAAAALRKAGMLPGPP